VNRAALLLLLLAAACSSAPSHPLSQEERLYRSKCTSCHRAFEPGERKDWPQVIDKMLSSNKLPELGGETRDVTAQGVGD